jgi:5-methylcytosine-specific restriction enzyme A
MNSRAMAVEPKGSVEPKRRAKGRASRRSQAFSIRIFSPDSNRSFFRKLTNHPPFHGENNMNNICISRLFEILGSPMRIVRKSWSSISKENGIAIFTIWEDELSFDGKEYCLWHPDAAENNRIGAKDIKIHCEDVLNNKYIRPYGIMQRAVNVNAQKRSRKWFDQDYVYPLSVFRKDGGYFATLADKIPNFDVIKKRKPAERSAIDDLDQPPPDGNEFPNRVQISASRFKRNGKVRARVIKMAKGKCEYCENQGFLMACDHHYIEAHHIINLAKQGPDTVNNVIALCPTHHREAHYGKNAEALEKEFILKINARHRAPRSLLSSS